MVRGEVVVTLTLGLVLCGVGITEGFPQSLTLSAFLSSKLKARLERSLVSMMGPPSHLLWARWHSEGPAATCRFIGAPSVNLAEPEGFGSNSGCSLCMLSALEVLGPQ